MIEFDDVVKSRVSNGEALGVVANIVDGVTVVGGGSIGSVQPGDGVEVDVTDPNNPVVSVDVSSLAESFQQVISAIKHGADPTGVADSSAALTAALVEAAGSASGASIFFPAGHYKFLSGGFTLDPSTVTIIGAGALQCDLDFTALTTGPAFYVRKSTSANHPSVVARGVHLNGPTDGATTVDCFVLGSASTYASQIKFHDLMVEGFRDQFLAVENAWSVGVHESTMRAAKRCVMNIPSTVVNSGEGMRFVDCTFAGAETGLLIDYSAAGVDLVGCSIDYGNKAAKVSQGSLHAVDCWWETGDATSGDCMIEVDITKPYNPKVSVIGGTFVPTYTAAGSCEAFIRITGNGASLNEQAVVVVDGLHVSNRPGNAGVNGLVVDDSTASDAASASDLTHVTVSGISYRDAGGTDGSYFPWYVEDRTGRKVLIRPGTDYGDLAYPSPQVVTVGHALSVGQETVSREIGGSGSLTLATGTVHLAYFTARKTQPVNSLKTIARGTAATGLTLARMGLYRVDAPNDLVRIAMTASNTGMWGSAFTPETEALTAETVLVAGQEYALACLAVGSGMPVLYGCNSIIGAGEADVAPRLSGQVAGQSDLPATISSTPSAMTAGIIYGVCLPT